jgi:hypothetical protein
MQNTGPFIPVINGFWRQVLYAHWYRYNKGGADMPYNKGFVIELW